jgi:hypothetical protein
LCASIRDTEIANTARYVILQAYQILNAHNLFLLNSYADIGVTPR